MAVNKIYQDSVAALADVLGLPGLSKGTYEMVSKSLENSDAG